MACNNCDKENAEVDIIPNTFQANKSISANYSLFKQSRSSRSTRYDKPKPKSIMIQPIPKKTKQTIVKGDFVVIYANGKIINLHNPKGVMIDYYEKIAKVMKKTDYEKSKKTETRQTKYSPTIQVKPLVIPVNTVPVVESVIVEKDCGWFGEKCFFDDISKGIDEAGKNMDNFVKDEIKKQDESWKWFNDGIQETQDGIAEFFEDEGKKQQETIKDIQDSIDSSVEWIQGGIEEKQQEIDSGIEWIQGGIDEKFEEFEKGVSWVQDGIDESLRSVGDGIGDISTGASKFFGDFVKGGQVFVKDIIDIPKDLKKGADDFNRNLLIIGAVGLGAVILVSRKE